MPIFCSVQESAKMCVTYYSNIGIDNYVLSIETNSMRKTSVFDLYFNCEGQININHRYYSIQIPKLELEENTPT